MDRIENCISFLLGKAAQQITRRAREALAPHGVTPPQYAVLKVLWHQDGQSGAELASRLILDSATLTGILDRLEGVGILERRADDDDRRVNRLHLTPKGSRLRKALDAAMDQLNAEVTRELGEAALPTWAALRKLSEVSL